MKNKLNLSILLVILLSPPLAAGEAEIINSARISFENSEYFDTITEALRYQYLYPAGTYYPESLVLLGKAYYKGNNYGYAAQMLSKCYNEYPGHPMGEESLFLYGYMRMMRGSPFYALRTFQEYRYVYKKGKYKENAAKNICYSSAFTGNLAGSLHEIKKFRKEFPESRFNNEIDKLEKDIFKEISRPRKSMAVSVAGSIFLPGFGHFYAGETKNGFLSLLTNALLIFMIYDGAVTGNRTQMIFFTVLEVSFYQYSIYSAINNVREFNSRKNFFKGVRLDIGTEF